MPLREYKCPICKKIVEILSNGANEVHDQHCDNCGVSLEVVPSVFGFNNSQKQWGSRSTVNFKTDTPKQVIQKQLKAASDAGHFDNQPPHIKRVRTQAADEALKTAVDVGKHE